jgi:antirestriction protein ArdC
MSDINDLILADMEQQAKSKKRTRKAKPAKSNGKAKRTRKAKPKQADESPAPPAEREGKWDPYEHVTNNIIEAIENGELNLFTSPWVKSGMPRNALTGRPYNGMNVLLCWAEMLRHEEWEWPLFLTWKQARSIEGDDGITGWPKEGESKNRTDVIFWKQRKYKATNEETGEEEEKTAPLIRVYGVFNVAQINDSGDPKIAARLLKHVPGHEWLDKPKERNKILDAWIDRVCEGMELPVKNKGDRACYIPSQDEIHRPRLKRFRSSEDYYGVTFHELIHATGHGDRLARDLKNRFGTEAYAFEELIAEFGAAFLCAFFNVQGQLQHAEYIASWVKRMQEDKYAIFTAAKHAKAAVEYLHKLGGEIEGV